MRRRRRPRVLLLQVHARVLGEVGIRRRLVLAAAKTLRDVDAAPVFVQRSSPLRGDVARGAVGVPETDHGRQRERGRTCEDDDRRCDSRGRD